MEINLWLGDSKSHLDYYTDFLTSQNTRFEITSCYFGNKIIVYTQGSELHNLSSHICCFIFDFYLKEAVISKIYDEYPFFNTDDASKILTEISHSIANTPINDSILEILKNRKDFNPESYVIFNLRCIMICIYALTDNISKRLISEKKKEYFISVIQTFTKLSFDSCRTADVEFSSENECIVSLDKKAPVLISCDELLAYLVHSAPKNVCLKNSFACPELSDIVSQIFNTNHVEF